MAAKVVKINSNFSSTPQTLLGMLLGHADKIKGIGAVIIWDDDTYQMVNIPMKHSEHAMMIQIMQRALWQEWNEGSDDG
jgi:hypothetical protein